MKVKVKTKTNPPQNYPDYCSEKVHVAYIYGIHQHLLFKMLTLTLKSLQAMPSKSSGRIMPYHDYSGHT